MHSSNKLIGSLICGVVLLLPLPSCGYPNTNLNQTFYSRPDLGPPKFEFSIYDEGSIAPGYILMTPYTPSASSNLAAGSVSGTGGLSLPNGTSLTTAVANLEDEQIQNGPYMYDHKGNLVYSGYGNAGPILTEDLKLAELNGKPVFSFYAGNDHHSGNRGHGVIMDETYKIVTSVQSGNGRTSNDIHEFTVLPDGTALTTIFQPTQYDLTPYGVQQPVGWVIQPIFQEIDIQTGEVLFEWRSLDHLDLSETYNSITAPGAGDGITQGSAWDIFHMNSIDKDSQGNYLVSIRYLCALLKINGKDGSIMWSLNGKESDFTFEGFNRTFAFQHHARILSENETTTVISLFDNGSDGNPNPEVDNAYSSGMFMTVDESTKVCKLLKQFHSPNDILSTSQGSTQLMSSGNVFMGWGSKPYVSEFAANGSCIMQGQFGADNGLAMNYRAFKINQTEWIGRPDSTPSIWTYANSTTGPTAIYVSWNGATQVASWIIYGGANESSTLPVIGTMEKDGFETTFIANAYYAWSYAEALDQAEDSLGQSLLQQTYVPAQNTTQSATAKYFKA